LKKLRKEEIKEEGTFADRQLRWDLTLLGKTIFHCVLPISHGPFLNTKVSFFVGFVSGTD